MAFSCQRCQLIATYEPALDCAAHVGTNFVVEMPRRVESETQSRPASSKPRLATSPAWLQARCSCQWPCGAYMVATACKQGIFRLKRTASKASYHCLLTSCVFHGVLEPQSAHPSCETLHHCRSLLVHSDPPPTPSFELELDYPSSPA